MKSSRFYMLVSSFGGFLWITDIMLLSKGVAMKTYKDNLPKIVRVHLSVHMLNADSPARAKGNGTGGHAHHSGFCKCDCEHEDINTEHGYDIDGKHVNRRCQQSTYICILASSYIQRREQYPAPCEEFTGRTKCPGAAVPSRCIWS